MAELSAIQDPPTTMGELVVLVLRGVPVRASERVLLHYSANPGKPVSRYESGRSGPVPLGHGFDPWWKEELVGQVHGSYHIEGNPGVNRRNKAAKGGIGLEGLGASTNYTGCESWAFFSSLSFLLHGSFPGFRLSVSG